MGKVVTVFTKKDCTWCSKLKNFLESCDIDYIEKSNDNSENLEEVKVLAEKLGMKDIGYPLTKIENNGNQFFIRGFNTKEFKDLYFKD